MSRHAKKPSRPSRWPGMFTRPFYYACQKTPGHEPPRRAIARPRAPRYSWFRGQMTPEVRYRANANNNGNNPPHGGGPGV
jgi:hypothetical protein